MKEVEWLKSLDHPGKVPAIDVSDSVLREIRSRGVAEAMDQVSPLAAILATLAGGGAIAAAIFAWTSIVDPLATFVEPLRLVLQ